MEKSDQTGVEKRAADKDQLGVLNIFLSGSADEFMLLLLLFSPLAKLRTARTRRRIIFLF